MANGLHIIGNHQIDFISAKHVIGQFEEWSGIKVEDGTYKTLNSTPKSLIESEAKFYCSYNHSEYNFEQGKMVKIISNYTPCSEIIILSKTILFNTNLLIKYWKPLLLKEWFHESLKSQFQHTSDNWTQLERFTKTLIQNLNGSELLFISDAYENITDACYEGDISIRDMLGILSKEYNSTEYNWIKGTELKNRLRYDWFNMTLDMHQNWILAPNGNLKKSL